MAYFQVQKIRNYSFEKMKPYGDENDYNVFRAWGPGYNKGVEYFSQGAGVSGGYCLKANHNALIDPVKQFESHPIKIQNDLTKSYTLSFYHQITGYFNGSTTVKMREYSEGMDILTTNTIKTWTAPDPLDTWEQTTKTIGRQDSECDIEMNPSTAVIDFMIEYDGTDILYIDTFEMLGEVFQLNESGFDYPVKETEEYLQRKSNTASKLIMVSDSYSDALKNFDLVLNKVPVTDYIFDFLTSPDVRLDRGTMFFVDDFGVKTFGKFINTKTLTADTAGLYSGKLQFVEIIY